MLQCGYGGVLPCAAAKATHPLPQQHSTSPPALALASDILLPFAASTVPSQPVGEDAAIALPTTIADVACTEALAAPEKQRTSKFSRILSRIFAASRGDGNSSDGKAEQHQLLLPCLLGDPFACLSVNRRVGVAAGTYLGRLSLFYGTDSSATVQLPQQHLFGESQKNEAIKGQVLLPQAYSDDGVAICWVDSSYLTAIMGASDLVQWKLPSLRCMGSEQLSLFAGRSSFNTVAISMRLLRRCEDTKQLQLMYRHCSKALANMILLKMQHPHREASLSMASERMTESRKHLQKAWACALAAGHCTLDKQQQQQQQQLPRCHSACLLGTGAACLMDLREGDMYERYEASYFSKLWRSMEASNFIALDFNGDFLLCCSGDGMPDRRWLFVVDARGAARLVEESQGWCAARRSYMDEFLVFKQLGPRRMNHARFLFSFFLLVSASNGICVYDLRLPFFEYYASRARSLGLLSRRAAAEAAAAGYQCCSGTCSNFKCTDQQRQPSGAAACGSGDAPPSAGLPGISLARPSALQRSERLDSSRETDFATPAAENHYHPFFLFERSPLAFRVAEAFFRFCSLLLQQQRQLLQLSSFNGDAHTPLHGSLKPPPPFTGKPMSVCVLLNCSSAWQGAARISRDTRKSLPAYEGCLCGVSRFCSRMAVYPRV
ncbi:uncharacterized protein LOC34623397 [Cyclospora cayetanensis]|uniref:Uncharacterized protein LOC34623397 n=1 Tax=Cyclospora cayetanensis TaxID=88456 RepID=A0A6P6RP74_9EIME|nr:uncharacterized protein LOC34623397 [Cyclospora cayetanensis]